MKFPLAIVLVVLACFSAFGGEHQGTSSLQVQLDVTDAAMLRDLVVTQWSGGISRRLSADVSGALLAIPGACRPGSTLVLESRNAFGVARVDASCSEALHVRMASRARIAATLGTPSGSTLPRAAILRLTGCDGEPESLDVPMTISEQRLVGSARSGCTGLSIRIDGFAPVRPETQALHAGVAHDLGTLPLRAGAAAVLRARSARHGDPMERVRITALRTTDASAIRDPKEVELRGLASAVTDFSGQARLTGLPAERLVFALQAPSRRQPQFSDVYELAAGEETVIDDLVVEPAANVLLTLSVPDALRDALALDMVELIARAPARLTIRADLTPSGALAEDVPPGTYTVHAAGRLKGGFAIKAAEATIDVTAGVDQQVSLTVSGALYSGRVTRGGLAVTGTINLRPADRRSRYRAAVARLDADGEFRVLLDGPGNYAVSIQTPTHDSVTLGKFIELANADDEVSIELPDGRIRGRVVDSAGKPVTDVGVTATQRIADPAGEVAGLNKNDGSFDLEGVAAGTWEVFAESKSERSEPVVVAVADDDAVLDGITLVVDPTYLVKVRVIGPGGEPVSGVFVEPEFSSAGVARKSYFDRTHENGEARFRLSHSERAIEANLYLATRDGRVSCVSRVLESDQTIALPWPTGDARIVLSTGFTREGSSNWLISPSGCAIPFAVRPVPERNGHEALVFRGLTPGTWRFVQAHSAAEVHLVLSGRGANLTSIRDFIVEPGSISRVDLSLTH